MKAKTTEALDELRAIVRLIECPFDRQSKKNEALAEAALRARAVIAREMGEPVPDWCPSCGQDRNRAGWTHTFRAGTGCAFHPAEVSP